MRRLLLIALIQRRGRLSTERSEVSLFLGPLCLTSLFRSPHGFFGAWLGFESWKSLVGV
jgi:hypothetical protein